MPETNVLCARWSTVAQRPINIRPRGYLGHAEKELARDKMDGRLGRPIGSNYCHRSVSQYGNTLHPSIHPSIDLDSRMYLKSDTPLTHQPPSFVCEKNHFVPTPFFSAAADSYSRAFCEFLPLAR